MKGCKYCRTPHQDILTFTVGEDKDGYEIIGHIDCDGQGLRYFDDIYEGGMCERVNINFCPMCGRDMRKEDEGEMKIDVKELYGNECWGWYDYQPMLDAFGKVAIQVDDDDYQGDSRLLYDENGKIGVLIFGWGSCSGCDALQACGSLEEVQELCDSLQEDIKWFDDKKQALEYFTNHDWQGDYSWHQTETKEFINKCIEYLSADHPTEKGGGADAD